MGLLKRLSSSSLALLLCLVVGGLVGWFAPATGEPLFVLGNVYLTLINMAALPLLVVATFFGLRQTLALPQPGRRTMFIVGLSAALVLACAVAGALLGIASGPGKNINQADLQYLGTLIQKSGGEAADARVTLRPSAQTATATQGSSFPNLVPDNFFHALVAGQPLGILVCAILFGLAFASLLHNGTGPLVGIFEAIYRSLETIISQVNIFIPFFAFAVAAYFAAKTDARTLHAMGSFLGSFFTIAIILSAAAFALICQRSGLPAVTVLAALKTPALISLASGSATATIPDTIEAMSARLGFSRGIVELIIPTSSVFLRAGAALYFAVLAVFVSNIYGQPLTIREFGLICVGASMASFASAGTTGGTTVLFAGSLLSMLNLPVEAALALLVAVDLLCDAPRNLLTLLFACVLIVLVSAGLPSERLDSSTSKDITSPKHVRLAFSRTSAVIALSLGLLAGMLITLAGVGVGMR
jgi:aerobic C4-dicarboxylate transport protein